MQYWEANCIWFNNTNLLKQAYYLAHNLQPEFNEFVCLLFPFSLSPFPPSTLLPHFLFLFYLLPLSFSSSPPCPLSFSS